MLNNNKKREKIDLKISGAFKTEENDYFCTVNIPVLFESEKKIFGIDELQSKQLAIDFVKRIFDMNNVVDTNEKPVDFCSIANEFFKKS